MSNSSGGIPFIGEHGFYPPWARGSGRWLFQRPLIVVGQLLGDTARIHALEVPASTQVIVWSPVGRFPLMSLFPSRIHRERQAAIGELRRFALVCYGDQCGSPKPGGSYTQGLHPGAVIEELGLYPEKWLLHCPVCGASVGPDLGIIKASPLVSRWRLLRNPTLENPGAAKGIRSAPPIGDLEKWIHHDGPSPLELAYVGQQMWSNIASMLAAMNDL
jgi:hypothetical protein